MNTGQEGTAALGMCRLLPKIDQNSAPKPRGIPHGKNTAGHRDERVHRYCTDNIDLQETKLNEAHQEMMSTEKRILQNELGAKSIFVSNNNMLTESYYKCVCVWGGSIHGLILSLGRLSIYFVMYLCKF